jgi:hypothetical protein
VTRQEAAVIRAAQEWRTMWADTGSMSPKSMALRRAVDALLKSSRPKKKVKRG